MESLDPRLVREVHRVLEEEGPQGLQVDDLTPADLALLAWSGSTTHIASVAQALERVASGDVEYLVVRVPGAEPIAKGGIDYARSPGAATLWQFATAAELQGLGIGTHLIAAAERRIQRRSVAVAELGVEDNNPRARALYERLGYREVGREPASWYREDAGGDLVLYETELAVLRKEL